MLPPPLLTDCAEFYSRKSGGAAFNPANEPAEMSGDRNQQHRAKREEDVENARRPLREFPLANSPATKDPDHSAPSHGEHHVQQQVSFEFCAFKLPLPCD